MDASHKNSSDASKDNLDTEGEINNTSKPCIEEKTIAYIAMKKKSKKRTFRIPLKIVEKMVGPGMALSKEFLSEASSMRRRWAKMVFSRSQTVFNSVSPKTLTICPLYPFKSTDSEELVELSPPKTI